MFVVGTVMYGFSDPCTILCVVVMYWCVSSNVTGAFVGGSVLGVVCLECVFVCCVFGVFCVACLTVLS